MDQVVKFDPAEAVHQYIKARRWKERRKKQYEAEVAQVTAVMDALEGRMLQKLDEDNATSIATPEGTFYRTTKDKASLSDPDLFVGFVRATDNLDLFERRVSITALRDHLDKGNELPPGVKLTTYVDVNVKAVSGKEYA